MSAMILEKAKNKALDSIIEHLRKLIAKSGDKEGSEDLVNPEEIHKLEDVEGHSGKHLKGKKSEEQDEETKAMQEEFESYVNRGSRVPKGPMGFIYSETKISPRKSTIIKDKKYKK